MTALRQRMLEDMQLRGLAPKTQEAYVRAVVQLAKYYDKSPELIDEEELRQYFLYLKNEKQASGSAITIALCGIKFLFEQTLQREWPVLELTGRPHERGGGCGRLFSGAQRRSLRHATGAVARLGAACPSCAVQPPPRWAAR